nr:peptide-methionine (S)-S-oxide reductase MsrA [Haloferula sp. BvORR071]
MKRRNLLALLFLLPTIASCEPEKTMSEDAKKPAPMPKVPEGAETITLGAGCFWCVEAAFKQLDGVYSATSGYMGGTTANPTYEQVCGGSTGHAEVVQVVFDPKKVTGEKVLGWFWELHDPTSLNKQGADEGTQYRSAIFYHTDAQKTLAEASKKAAQEHFEKPIVTEIVKAGTFYPAENYHQDFYFLNKNKNGYCRMVIEPKLKKLKLDH